jgi:Sulfotransferase domain
MTLRVIGAGFGRTGTLSLKFALEMLGIGPCYHMVEVFKNPQHSELWSAAADGNVDWDKLFAGYASTVDWPSVHFWRELADYYPNAKLILTKRSTASWVKSVNETIFRHLDSEPTEDNPVRAGQMRMAKKLVLERTFGGSVADPEHIGKVFEAHNEEVLRTIPAERLLVYEAREGWEPLCKFLGVPVPNVEYPRVNTTEEFQSRFSPT